MVIFIRKKWFKKSILGGIGVHLLKSALSSRSTLTHYTGIGLPQACKLPDSRLAIRVNYVMQLSPPINEHTDVWPLVCYCFIYNNSELIIPNWERPSLGVNEPASTSLIGSWVVSGSREMAVWLALKQSRWDRSTNPGNRSPNPQVW